MMSNYLRFRFDPARNEGDPFTSGPGVYRSVMTAVYDKYLQKGIGKLCTDLFDNYVTLSTIPVPSYNAISDAKCTELGIFGAVVGLSLVDGHWPSNISPFLLIYLLCDCDLASIRRFDLLEYFPTLYTSLREWLVLPLNSSAEQLQPFRSLFASYLQLQVHIFYSTAF